MSVQFRLLFFVTASLICLPEAWTAAADGDQEPATADGLQQTEVPPDPFLIPDGTPAELLQFVRQVKRLRPTSRSRETVSQHVRKQVNTIERVAKRIAGMETATDRDQLVAMEEQFVAYSILARTEPAAAHEKVVALNASVQEESRPEFIDVADFHLLQSNVARTDHLDSDPAEVADEIGKYIEQHGLDRVVLGYAQSVGVRMTRRGQSEAAGQLFSHLAKTVRASDDADLQEDLPYLESTARRLNLPGKFMVLQGPTADGRPFDWDSYRGKYVVVDFWATWCAPCRAEVPNLKHHLELYEDQGLAIVGVNIDEDRAEYDSYMAEARLPWQQIMPADNGRNRVAEYYAINAFPTIMLLGPDGKVIALDASGERLGALLAEHLGPPPQRDVPDEPTGTDE